MREVEAISPNKKILVVDDTEATRYAIVRTLKSAGYAVIEAADGQRALELVKSCQPDLVTLDIHLPDILGFEVCRRIKADSTTSHIPVLQVSASYVTSKDRIHGLEGGADSYLTHPFEPPVLLATIRALLRSRELTVELRLTEERFKVALKYAPIMTYANDLDLRYTWVFNAPTALASQDLISKTDFDLFSKAEATAITEAKKEVLKTGIGKRATLTASFGGMTRCYDMTIEPHRANSGQIVGLTVACIDVTERIQIEEAHQKAREEAELANKAKTSFISNMSHEIRTPLGIIQGFAELSLDPQTTKGERNTYLITIRRNAEALTKLLGEILDLAKVEAGKMELEHTNFSFTELLGELVEAMSLNAREKGLELSLQYDGPFPQQISSDPVRCRQILMNLVSNALKFTERGSVRIRVRAVPSEVSTKIEVRVTDTGIGLSPAQQQKLFERFVQADSTTTRRFGGTGLGLSLSKKLANALGGDLILEQSQPRQGSTFLLALDAGPLQSKDFVIVSHKSEPEFRPAPLSQFTNQLQGMRILLVDDSVDNQILFSRYLKQMGADFQVASDGVEALTKTADDFDAILMDVQMPNLDGYEATRVLRLRGYSGPIIALTAHALKEGRDRALGEGFTDYLTKPLDIRLLAETLTRHKNPKLD